MKLIDFGTAKFLESNNDSYQRTFTVVGTPYYTAPEVISQKGYLFTADYWSLGVLLYEIAIGYVPFGCDESDVFQIYQEILTGQLEFPSWFTENEECKSIITQLLNKSPEARVGNSISSLKVHPWFNSIDWVLTLFIYRMNYWIKK